MNKSNYLIPFESICRTCLISKEDMKPVRDPAVVKLLHNCVSLQISQDDRLPDFICLQCLHQMYKYFDFKLLCEKSDTILRQFVSEGLLPIEFQALHKDENSELSSKDECNKNTLLNANSSFTTLNKSSNHQSEDEDTTGFVDCPELDLEPECNLVENALAALQEDLEKKNFSSSKFNANFAFEPSSPNITKIEIDSHLNPDMENIDITEKQFPCSQCPDVFTSINDLTVHLSIHSTDVIKCNICHKTFLKMKMLKRHIKTHMISKAYRCHICSKEFTESGALNRHIRRHNGISPEKKFFCLICGKGYQDQTYLAVHNRKHTGERPFQCNQCSKTFTEQRLLVSHTKTHSQDKLHECIVCSKRFAHSSTLTTHLRTHTGVKPYACKICSKRFIQSSNLSLHMRTHTGAKPYKCKVCNKSFASSSTLTYHSRTHTGEKPYLCSVCGKSFARSEDVTLHMRTHTGERPYECTVCQKRFTTSSHRNQHMFIHASEKSYVCKLCDNWNCVSLANLKKHNLEVHGETDKYSSSNCNNEKD